MELQNDREANHAMQATEHLMVYFVSKCVISP